MTPKIVAIMPVRNEDWVLGLTLRAALEWVDEVIVLDHCSVDGTREIIYEVCRESQRCTFIEDARPDWHEMAHRQALLQAARFRGATHIVLLDADEVLTGNLLDTIRGLITSTSSGECAELPMYCLWRGLGKYRFDAASKWGRMWTAAWFADSPNLYWKSRNGYDFHHRHPMGSNLGNLRPVAHGKGGLLHLQFVDWKRLRAKQALYKMTEALRWPQTPKETINGRYDPAVNENGLALAPVPDAWWAPYQHLLRHLNLDGFPWQAGLCKRLMQEYGPDKFAGMDLFGVAP